jgi:hypothetical protein
MRIYTDFEGKLSEQKRTATFGSSRAVGAPVGLLNFYFGKRSCWLGFFCVSKYILFVKSD